MGMHIGIFDEISAEFLPHRSTPNIRGVQIDGVCPHCKRWHTLALRNGLPCCFVIGNQPDRRTAAKGGVQ